MEEPFVIKATIDVEAARMRRQRWLFAAGGVAVGLALGALLRRV